MTPTKIFLDLDDVLNRFTMYALAHVGCPVDPMSEKEFNPEWQFNIIAAADALHPYRKFTPKTFWSMFNRGTWAAVPESKEFDFLLNACEKLVGRENVCILTTPVLDPGCAAGKVEWIYDHCPKWLHRQFLIGPVKHLCASPDALLIDDGDHNIEAFRIGGGQALLVPRPWNSLHEFSNETEMYLRRSLEDIFNELIE